MHKFSHAMDDIPAWEVRGTSYGFSSIGIPITHPGLDSFNKAISVWMDEKIQSKSNMAALAELSERVGSEIPATLTSRLGRVGVPDDIGRVVLFCASDMSMFMTGSTLLVDAGEAS